MLSPSPWSVSDKEIYIRDQDGQQVCLMGPLSTVEDARIIAAAPALLAALRDMLNLHETFGAPFVDVKARFDAARAAIAKAEGK